MADPAIRIEGVGKRFHLGTGSHGNLSQALESRLRAPFRRVLGRPALDPAAEISDDADDDDFWALRDVSFEVERGTVMGLIGANGAGKSTLLKILARITSPTEGRITYNGRIASLLEVGTGFHPELTGRENVFLNGVVLGMKRREIAERYNEIVEFSGIDRFLETPVKRYSSGMYVRLAFSVAVHLEADILLLDEVLAVGDAEFQRKCMDKVDAMVDSGRTVVFVSHAIQNVHRLCDRCAWLEGGRLAEIGPTGMVASRYFKNTTEVPMSGVAEIPDDLPRAVGASGARVRRVALLDEADRPLSKLHLGQPFSVAVTVEVSEPIEGTAVEIGINAIDGTRAVTAHSSDEDGRPLTLAPGTHEVHASIEMTLLPGDFTIDVGVHRFPEGPSYEHLQRVLTFTALPTSLSGADRYPWEAVRGSVRPSSAWSVRSKDEETAAAQLR